MLTVPGMLCGIVVPRVWLIHLGDTDACIWAPWSYFEFLFGKDYLSLLVLSQHWLCVVQSMGLRVIPKIIECMS